MALRAERSGASLHEKNLENTFAFSEIFKCLSIATPCLEKGRAFYCMAVGAGIVRPPELRGGCGGLTSTKTAARAREIEEEINASLAI